jgi:hypothetical protein
VYEPKNILSILWFKILERSGILSPHGSGKEKHGSAKLILAGLALYPAEKNSRFTEKKLKHV